MDASWEREKDENEITFQECMRIERLARAVDELVAWDFIMNEKEIILTELEKAVGIAEGQLVQAEKSLGSQHRHCALLPVTLHGMGEGEGKRQPRAARGDNRELNAMWKEHGGKFIEQYKRHLARYRRVGRELLEGDEVTSEMTTADAVGSTTNEKEAEGK